MKQVLILSQFNYQTFPIVSSMIQFKESDLKEIGKTKCFDVENQCITNYTKQNNV